MISARSRSASSRAASIMASGSPSSAGAASRQASLDAAFGPESGAVIGRDDVMRTPRMALRARPTTEATASAARERGSRLCRRGGERTAQGVGHRRNRRRLGASGRRRERRRRAPAGNAAGAVQYHPRAPLAGPRRWAGSGQKSNGPAPRWRSSASRTAGERSRVRSSALVRFCSSTSASTIFAAVCVADSPVLTRPGSASPVTSMPSAPKKSRRRSSPPARSS